MLLELAPIVVNLLAYLIFLGFVIAGIGLLVSIIKESQRKKDLNENASEEGLITLRQLELAMEEFINHYKTSNQQTLFIFEVTNYDSMKEAFGVKQALKFKRQMLNNIIKELPKNALMCEYDDDTYAILLRGKISKDKIELFAQELIDIIEGPISIPVSDGGTVNFACYLGAIIYPLHGRNVKELLRNAELSLYSARKENSQKFVMFSMDMQDSEKENLDYYNEIKKAIKSKQFTLYYQPIMDSVNNRIAGFEALIRWVHPSLGVLPPAKFLNIMEHSGDIIWVGKWGLEVICKQYNEWHSLFPNEKFYISFNLSTKQLMNPNLISDFNSIFRQYKVEPSNICFEVVEYTIYEKHAIILENIKKLADLGCKVSLDDFGNESNTLVKLQSSPISQVKLHYRYLMESKSNFVLSKLLEMLIEVCQNTNRQIVTVGVETKDQLEEINKLNLSLIQGWLISKPISPTECKDFIASNKS